MDAFFLIPESKERDQERGFSIKFSIVVSEKVIQGIRDLM